MDVSMDVFKNPNINQKATLPETNSSPLKIGLPNRKGSYSNHPFSGAMLVSGRVRLNQKSNLWVVIIVISLV